MTRRNHRILLALSLFTATALNCDKRESDHAVEAFRPAEEAAVEMDEAEPASVQGMADGEAPSREMAPKKKAKNGDSKEDDEPETWKRSKIVPHTSKLQIGDDQTLQIRGMETRVRVDGFRARVLIDYYFYNPHDQQFKGTFKVRLPNEASPYFLAFGQSKVTLKPDRPFPLTDTKFDAEKPDFVPQEIMQARQASWIEPKRARIVPKEKAAHAFTETVRRRVDPALMEWAGPGTFSAQLFPIAPKKVHRVVIGYDANLTAIGDDYEFRVPLPEDVPSTSVHVAVTRMNGVGMQVEPKGATDETPSTLHYSYSNPEKREIRVRLKKADSAGIVGDDGERSYFAAQFVPELPSESRAKNNSAAVFMVDTSLTSNPDRFNVWRKLLRAILENNRGQLDRFAVMFFNVESFWWRTSLVKNDATNVDALMKMMDTLALEGATDVGQAFGRLEDAPMDLSGADVFLLSDGAVTWGEGDPYALSSRLAASGGSLFAYRTGMTGDDSTMLQHLTRESGGALFSVVGESEVKTASRGHTARPWSIRSVAVESGEDVLLAGRPRTLFPGQRLTVVGRGRLSPNTKVTLTLQRGEQTREVVTTIDHVVVSPLAPRTYGQVAVGQLEEFLGSTRRFAEAYARHFRVPGKSSSLLMLESEADYERFDIRPKNDAGVVDEKLTGNLVLNALDELIMKLGNPRAAFTDWAERASEMPDVHLKFSPEFQKVLAELPAETFEVQPAQLQCDVHTWKALSGALRGELAKQDPSYDTVTTDAERRLKKYGAGDALKALSSLVEKNPADGTLARDIGYSATRWGLHEQAYHLFRRVADSRPWEPQTYHGMALALAEAGRADLAMVYFEVALSGQWHSRFGSFRQIVELDYLRFLRKTSPKSFHESARTYAKTRRAQLTDSVGVDGADLVVVISWNTDNTDIDLHVIEPSGEECYYEHTTTKSGGQLTQDVTQGYGPEMFVLKNAPKGQYRIRAKYYSTDRNRAGTRTKVQATIYRDWGKPSERVIRRVVTMVDGKEMHDIVKIKI